MRIRDLFGRREHPEDPDAGLDRWFHEQLGRLEEMRGGLAAVVAARASLDMSIAAAERQAPREADQASAAATLEDLGRERDDLRGRERDLRAELARMEIVVREVHAQTVRLRATRAAAEGRVRVTRAAAAIDAEMDDLHVALSRAVDDVDRARAHAAALEEILGRGGPGLPA